MIITRSRFLFKMRIMIVAIMCPVQIEILPYYHTNVHHSQDKFLKIVKNVGSTRYQISNKNRDLVIIIFVASIYYKLIIILPHRKQVSEHVWLRLRFDIYILATRVKIIHPEQQNNDKFEHQEHPVRHRTRSRAYQRTL